VVRFEAVAAAPVGKKKTESQWPRVPHHDAMGQWDLQLGLENASLRQQLLRQPWHDDLDVPWMKSAAIVECCGMSVMDDQVEEQRSPEEDWDRVAIHMSPSSMNVVPLAVAMQPRPQDSLVSLVAVSPLQNLAISPFPQSS
jgi:hypothetical protein